MSTRKSPYHLSAQEAAELLGITRATLYAYASRGQVRSEPVPGKTRERRYFREDLERLKERQDARRDPTRVAARGLHWGGPVLESGITLIHDGGLYYRGHNAIALAEAATVEEVAAHLWQEEASAGESLFEQGIVLSGRHLQQIRRCTDDLFAQMQAALAISASMDLASHDLRPAAVRLTGARIMRLLATVITQRMTKEPIHLALRESWVPRRDDVGNALRATMVLCADHELNVSAFTARCTASAGASPYDVVTAAMATLKGYKHGGAADRVLAMLDESATLKGARAVIARRLRSGERVPGFGHRLYPSGDPRGALLLRFASKSGNPRARRSIQNLIKAGSELLNDLPNLDLGLAGLTRSYALPAQAPLLLFALGRTVGWIAHAIEEYASGQLVRPRARYVGPTPIEG